LTTEKSGWLSEQFSKAQEYYKSVPTWKKELVPKSDNE
jgi:hypothetical protein